MKLRVLVMSVGMLVYLGLASCENSSKSLLTTSVTSATLSDCEAVCRTLSLELHVKNGSSRSYCLPESFVSSEASDHIVGIGDQPGMRYTSTRSTGYKVHGLGVGTVDEYLSALKSGPNFVIIPGSSIIKHVYLRDSFEMPRKLRNIAIEIYMYPCDEPNIISSRTFHSVIMAPVQFE
jgi:hypothetical protein